jgi:hypothetical protein
MSRYPDLISYVVIDHIVTAARVMGIASPIPTATNVSVIRDIEATAIGQMLILRHSQLCSGSNLRQKIATDWATGYHFNHYAPLTRTSVFESLARFQEGPASAPGYETSAAGKFIHRVAFTLIAQTLDPNSRTAWNDLVTPWDGGILGPEYFALSGRDKDVTEFTDRGKNVLH